MTDRLSGQAARSASLPDTVVSGSKETMIGFAIIAFGLVLRVLCALRFPFDEDELYTVIESRDLFATKLLPGIDSRPLYYLLQHPLLKLLPDTPLMLRLLPLLFGTVGIWVTWRLGRRWLGANAGLVAAFLAAISPWHLYASTTARYYSLVYLCAALTLWGLTEAYDSDSPRAYLWTLVALMVGALTHPSFIITTVGAVFGLALVTKSGTLGWRWPSRRAWTFLWIPFLALLATEVLVLRLLGRSSAMANVGGRGLSATLRLLPAMVDWMTVTVFVAAICGAFLLAIRTSPRRRVGVMAISAVAISFVLLFIASTRTGVYADYGVGMLPLVFVAAAAAVTLGSAVTERVSWPSVALLVLVAGSAPSIVSFLSDGLRYDYRPAYARIEKDAPNVAVFTWPTILQLKYAPKLRAYEWRADSAYLNRTIASESDMWAVVAQKRYGVSGDDGRQIATWLTDHCKIVDSYERPRFDYRLYRVELYRCHAAAPATSSATTPSPTVAVR